LNCPQVAAHGQPFDLGIIYEDNHVVVVIKPQNVPCCPDESGDANLLDELKKKYGFVGLVHRLDRVTGGVMIYAKTTKAASRLSEQIRDGRMEKTYLAVVCGTPKERSGTLVNHLYKNELQNTVTVVPSATTGAKRAELSYTILPKPPKEKQDISLVSVKLDTGRSHQIRVQFAHIGCPIFGDAKYGGDKLGKGWKLALWAHKLTFVHPTTEDKMTFIVNPPDIVPWTGFDFERQSHKQREKPPSAMPTPPLQRGLL